MRYRGFLTQREFVPLVLTGGGCNLEQEGV